MTAVDFEWWHAFVLLGIVAATAFVWGFFSAVGRAVARAGRRR